MPRRSPAADDGTASADDGSDRVPPSRGDAIVSANDGGEEETSPREETSGSGRLWPWIVAGIVALLVAGGAFWLLTRPENTEPASGPQPPLIRVAKAGEAETLTIRQTGFVRPRARIEITSEVAGRIDEVSDAFALGRRIEEGELLVRLERASFEADIARSEAGVEQAEAALAQARLSRQRQEELEDRDFASEARLQEAIVAVATARADLAAAEADLTRSRQALSDTEIVAPFAALVTAANAARGQLLQPGQSVGTLVAADAVEIPMGLVAPQLAILGDAARALGGEVRVMSPEGQDLATGVVTEVDPQIEASTRATVLVVTVTDPFAAERGRPLRVDELVELRLPVRLPEPSAIRLPIRALKGGEIVWSVEEGGLVRHEVRVLQRGEAEAVVVAPGIEPGSRVMLSDLAAAFDGQPVRIAETDAPRSGEETPPAPPASVGRSAPSSAAGAAAEPGSELDGPDGNAAADDPGGE